MKSFNNFCSKFYHSTFFPIHFFDSENQMYYSYPKDYLALNSSLSIIKTLVDSKKNPNYIITDSLSYIGIIKINNTSDYIILGPIFSTPLPQTSLKTFMNEYEISIDNKESLFSYIQSIPLISLNQFFNILSFLHFAFNEEDFNVFSYFNLSNEPASDILPKRYSTNIYNSKEDNSFHNTYPIEKHYLKYIENGEPDKLKSYIFTELPSLALKEGTIAPDALRQAKNIFIASVTMATRSAISGGLAIEKAYHISDVYIQEIEQMQSILSIQTIQLNMLIDFAERVSRSKLPEGISKEIFSCVQFISQHTNEEMDVNSVCDFIHRSRSYISQKFKKEMGIELSKFIIKCKLDDAKDLLEYSDKSLSEISNYLCFSSQAYFHNTFKKFFGLTPGEYRKLVRD